MPHTISPRHRQARLAALCGCAALAFGAVVAADNSISGFSQVTVSPGDTASCDSNPCQVFLNIPAGSGSVVVTGNEVTWGTYPTGQTADLGQVFNSTAFQIQGMDVPKVWVYMPNEP